MTRFEYLEALDRLLNSLPYSERREIMYDYEEHFNEGLKEGKTEEEIILELGPPDKIAIQYITALVPVQPEVKNSPNEKKPANQAPKRPVRKKGNGIGEIVALSIIMVLFNCFFIGFYLGYWGILIAFVAVGAVFVIIGFVLLLSTVVAAPVAFLTIPTVLFQYPILMLVGSVIFISIGGLMLIGMFYIIKYTCILSSRYIKWNIQLVRGF